MSDRAARIGTMIVLWLFAAMAVVSCASFRERFIPPSAAWPVCARGCEAEGGMFIGIVLPTENGPAICACADKPPRPVQPEGGT